MADIVEDEYYDLYEENLNIDNQNNDLMDVAMIPNTENINVQPLKLTDDGGKIPDIQQPEQTQAIARKLDVPMLFSSYNGPKFGLYVANLSWWITDKQLSDMCKEFGINDLLEIKFFENKGTGVSKGFALLMFGTIESAQLGVSKFASATIEGTKLIALFGTKQNYESLKQHANEFYPNQSRHRTELESDIALQIVLKNQNLISQVVNSQQAQSIIGANLNALNNRAGNNSNHQPQQFNQYSNNNAPPKNDQESSNPELLSQLKIQTNEAIKETIFKLMDCAEDIRQSEISRERPVKLLLDELYDTKRMLTARNDRKRIAKPPHHGHHQNDAWENPNDRSPSVEYRRHSPYQSSRNRDSRHKRTSSHGDYGRRSRSRTPPNRRYR
ncbi:MAG: Cleavage and polyadenylation specificity factor subunit 6 [Marteilia pararefringens]